MFAYGETVTLLSPGTSTDKYGDTTESWASPTSVDVDGCGVAPRMSDEATADGDRVVIGLTVYLPAGTAVTAKQRVVVRGDEYDIDGEPADWRSPLTGWEPGIEIALKRAEG